MPDRFQWLKTSPARLKQVAEDISYGSEPKVSFYALLMTSSLIASFGLILNSGAAIIGAMLVCPLMTPMLGISLSLVRGDAFLLGRAIRAEAIGMVLAVGIASLLGFFPLALEVNKEMLALTEPTLLDLLVAGLAGFAGTYAMIDARLSPALPGVAIATSIMPPLANTGLCLAVGAYQGAWGSFLLFLANFLTILLVSAGTFFAAGVSPEVTRKDKWEFTRRFGVAAVGFLLVTALLTQTLVRIVRERYLSHDLKGILSAQFSQFPSTSLSEEIHRVYQGRLYVLATVRTPRVISPDKVKAIQETLTETLKRPTELIVRALLAKDVSATGSTSQVTAQNLDGFFLSGLVAPEVLRSQQAEQALRELLLLRPDILLQEVDLLQFPCGPVILATLQGSRIMIPAEVQELEKRMQERLQDPQIRLLTRCLTTVDVDARGRILYAWSHFGSNSPEDYALQERVEKEVRAALQKYPDLFITNVDALASGEEWAVRVEAVGTRVLGVRELAQMEKSVSQKVHRPTKIYLWFRSEVMVTREGLSSVEDFTRKRLQEQSAKEPPKDKRLSPPPGLESASGKP
ncbi:MAG: DUF389 domain-containing protein [Deltaproteobacteria bacterium]|nr:MAG: DUF389 domain-containing protein [Deltaproteobacteria bacterium]